MKMTQFRRRRQKIWSIKEDQNFFCFVQIIQYDIIKSERCNFKKNIVIIILFFLELAELLNWLILFIY